MDSQPSFLDRLVRLAGVAGMLTAILGISVPAVATVMCGSGCGTGTNALNPFSSDGSFSWSTNALSDLGVSRVADFFNYGLMVLGLPFFIFAVGVARIYSRSRLSWLGTRMIIAASVSVPLIGVFTENSIGLHWAASLGWFVFFPIGTILIGFSSLRLDRVRAYLSLFIGTASLTTISTGLVLYAELGVRVYTSRYGGFAILEFSEVFLNSVWVLYTGLRLAVGKFGLTSNFRESRQSLTPP